MTNLDLDIINSLTGGFDGTYDVACPICGPDRRQAVNRRRKVLRVWVVEGFTTYNCARCGASGYVRDQTAPRPDPVKLMRMRAAAAEHECVAAAVRLKKAMWLWSRRRPDIRRTIVETYLREARGYAGDVLPATLGYLPATSKYEPAMIAAFGLPIEPEPGRLLIRDDAVRGIHITRLKLDGSAKADTEQTKIMIGRSVGHPIVISPPSDLHGMAITEGIEDALSVYEGTGLGVWAAGCASRMPALAPAIPSTIEAVTIYAHSDPDGQKGARTLAQALAADLDVYTVGVHAGERVFDHEVA